MARVATSHPNADVRMRGFAQRSTVDEAWDWIDSVLPKFDQLPTEQVALRDAAQRVLAQDVISPVDVPGFVRSMMDGFALRSEETYGATTYNPLSFRIVGTCLPGQPFGRSVTTGEAVRIMTGAPVPEGVDAVLPVEQTQIVGETLQAMDQISAGKHLGLVGEDVRRGELIFSAGRILRPQDLGVLSSMGLGTVQVVKPPKIQILVTGNEVLPAGSVPDKYQIVDANGPMLSALVRRDGGETSDPKLVADHPEKIQHELNAPADVILVTGGSSWGAEDFVPK